MSSRQLYCELRKNSPDLADELDKIVQEARQIWSGQFLRAFTEHGFPHIEQVEANLDAITRPLQAGLNPLSAMETYVLLAACYLHDIGMQLDEPDARARHAEYAHELILYSSASVGQEERRVTLPIKDDNAREAIAEVAKAHWTEFALKLPHQTFLFGNVPGRLRLLGALLATADLLDLSPVRARYYRSVHRLDNLGTVSELHQTMHRWVRGFTIVPARPDVPGDLQFKITWRDDHQEVREAADWVLRWFTSQWRQLSPMLHAESGGSIRWATPWLKVSFDRPAGPTTRLSQPAYRFLQAERSEQRRVDRKEFADCFKKSLTTPNRTLFVLRSDSEWDGQALREWCEHQAGIVPHCRVARLNVPPAARLDTASMVAQLLELWGHHLPRCDEEEALRKLHAFLMDTEDTCAALIATDNYGDSGLEPIIEAILHQDNLPAARVCVLLTDGATGPTSLNGVEVYRPCGDPYTSDDIGSYLHEQLGYGTSETNLRLSDIRTSRNLQRPGIVLEIIEQWEAGLIGID